MSSIKWASLAAVALAATLSAPAQQVDKPKGEDPSQDDRMKAEVARQLAERDATRWQVGLNPLGGGAFIKSPDGKVYFRLYAYAQPQLTWTDGGNHNAFEHTDFRVRRARIDFAVDYDDRFKLFVELDAAPADGTALVEGYAQGAVVRDRLVVRAGKYITPFSTENLRSSRALDTVERYIALNTMFGLPGLDVQFGPMLFGNLDAGKKVSYFVGVFNGNSSAAGTVVNGQRGNARDNNGTKEFQARLNFKPIAEVIVGGAYDVDNEDTQTLQISSYSGAKFVATTVKGKRRGFDVDAHWKKDRCSFDTEWLDADFRDSDAKLHGGYAQVGYWVRGTEAKGGVQAILRAEYAQLSGGAVERVDGRTMEAITAGANVWWLGAARLQVNAIAEHVNGNGNGTFTGGSRWRPTLLSQFQVKF